MASQNPPELEESAELVKHKNVLVVQCLAEGMPLNVAARVHGSTFKTANGGEECAIHPSSALFGKTLTK